MGTAIDRDHPRDEHQNNRHTRAGRGADEQDVHQQPQHNANQSDVNRTVIRAWAHTARSRQNQSKDDRKDRDTCPYWRCCCFFRGNRCCQLFFGEFHAFCDATCGFDLGRLCDGRIPSFLAVKFNHRSLAILAHIRTQARALSDV